MQPNRKNTYVLPAGVNLLNMSNMTRPGEQSTMIDADRDRDRIKNHLAGEVDDYLNTEKGEGNSQFMNDSYPA